MNSVRLLLLLRNDNFLVGVGSPDPTPFCTGGHRGQATLSAEILRYAQNDTGQGLGMTFPCLNCEVDEAFAVSCDLQKRDMSR